MIEEEIVKDVIDQIKDEVGEEIFTIAVRDKDTEEKALNVIVVFENKAVMEVRIGIEMEKKGLALRVQGNFL